LFAVEVLGVLRGARVDVLLLLIFTTFVKVLDDNTDEHVEHKETDEQQERDEVEQAPLVVVDLWLQRHAYYITTSLLYYYYNNKNNNNLIFELPRD